MICLLIKNSQSQEAESYWSLGKDPVTYAERVLGLQASDKELQLIFKILGNKSGDQEIQSWFGLDAKKIAILVGAAK